MTGQIHIDVAAAQAALDRSDFGDPPLPGDAALIAAYDGYLQQHQAEVQDRIAAQEWAEWLASQCGGCVPGGTGEACDDHWEDS